MADIKSYMKEKEKRERRQTGYKEKIVRHKLTTTYRTLLLVAAIVALVMLVIIQYRNHIYTSYDVVQSIEKEKVGGTTNLRLGESILTYSKDGAHCIDVNGNVTWNQTFEIQDVELAFSGDTVAIGDYNGRSIYVANPNELLGTITTTMPIRDLAVAQTGRVTAVLADTDVAWINTYDSDGKLCYKGQASMNNSGYPTAISLSPNGDLLAVAYMYLDAGVLKTNVAFYNFGEVGDNYSDHFVGVHIYPDLVVPYIQFMNDSTAFAVGDSRLMIYKGSQKPVSQAEYLYDKEVRSIYYNEDYVGLVFLADNTENRYMLEVYNANGERACKYYFDMDYTDVFFGKDNFVIYNETKCQIVNLDGTIKYDGDFLESVEVMVATGNTYKYVLLTDDSIDTIQLK